MKIAIGTTSELKIRALKDALEKLGVEAEIAAVKTESGVSNQPFGYKEMIKGAKNRATEALGKENPDMALGVESGLTEIEGNYFEFACVYILSKNRDESIAYSSGYFIPQWIIDEIKEKNTEHGHIIQRLSGAQDKDPLTYYSGGLIKREELLSQAIEIALVKLFNQEKYLRK